MQNLSIHPSPEWRSPWKFSLPESNQPNSTFFGLPRELRDAILEITLMQEFVDDSRDETSHSRSHGLPPGFRWKLFPEPLITFNALLTTCQRLHHEARRISWTSWDVVVFLQPYEGGLKYFNALRAARIMATGEQYAAPFNTFIVPPSATRIPRYGFQSIRIIGKYEYLDSGKILQTILNTSVFLRPSRIIIRIRHTDWYGWQSDEALGSQARFVNDRYFPDCLTEIVMELETVAQKTDQLKEFARQIQQHWRFRKWDGSLLSADPDNQTQHVTAWTGTSFIEDQRWLRDESAPGEITYHVLSVRFTVAVTGAAATTAQKCQDIWLDDDQFPRRFWIGPRSVYKSSLSDRQIPLNTGATEVNTLLLRFQRECRCATRHRRCCRNPKFVTVGSGFQDFNFVNQFCQACQTQGCTDEKRGRAYKRGRANQIQGNQCI